LASSATAFSSPVVSSSQTTARTNVLSSRTRESSVGGDGQAIATTQEVHLLDVFSGSSSGASGGVSPEKTAALTQDLLQYDKQLNGLEEERKALLQKQIQTQFEYLQARYKLSSVEIGCVEIDESLRQLSARLETLDTFDI